MTSAMTFANDMLASTVESYLSRRYPGERLRFLARNLMGDDKTLAIALEAWRVAAKWPDVNVIGETRCANCNRLMRNASVCEDEEICERCGKNADLAESSRVR